MVSQKYTPGEKVEYHPVGGANPNVSSTTGIITNITQTDDGIERYTIKNDSTGKETTYQEKNIIRKV